MGQQIMPVETIRIRDAGPGDTALLAGLVRRSFRDVAERFLLTPWNCPKHPSNCTKSWIEKDLGRGARYFVLEGPGGPVGCVALEKADKDLCYLERLAVLPEERKNGYGKALLAHALSRARGLGATTVGIGIIAEDEGLKAWYRNLGFAGEGIKQFDHLPFTVAFMTREL